MVSRFQQTMQDTLGSSGSDILGGPVIYRPLGESANDVTIQMQVETEGLSYDSDNKGSAGSQRAEASDLGGAITSPDRLDVFIFRGRTWGVEDFRLENGVLVFGLTTKDRVSFGQSDYRDRD